jgi:hypothetical protein
MKIFTPAHSQEVATGVFTFLLTLGLSIFALVRLTSAEVSSMLLIWVVVPLLGLPLASLTAYRLYGLLTAQYALDRNGFYLRWGLSEEHIPIGQIRNITAMDQIPARVTSRWKGLLGLTGVVRTEDRELDFFTAGSLENAVLLSSDQKNLVLTPADPADFIQVYRDFSYRGSLQRIKPHSVRPVFLAAVLAKDTFARWLLPAGLVVNFLLLAFLVLANALPSPVPFSYDAAGNVALMAPVQRLLLLPLIGGVLWMINVLLGTWFYHRKADHRMGYILWAASLLPGLLLWGSVINILSTAAG